MLKIAEQRLSPAHSLLNQPAGRTVQVRCFQMTENKKGFEDVKAAAVVPAEI